MTKIKEVKIRQINREEIVMIALMKKLNKVRIITIKAMAIMIIFN